MAGTQPLRQCCGCVGMCKCFIKPHTFTPCAGGLSSGQDPASAAALRFWAAGLSGRGVTIGVGDTGVDVDSCYFHDAAVPFATQVWELLWMGSEGMGGTEAYANAMGQ